MDSGGCKEKDSDAARKLRSNKVLSSSGDSTGPLAPARRSAPQESRTSDTYECQNSRRNSPAVIRLWVATVLKTKAPRSVSVRRAGKIWQLATLDHGERILSE